MKRYDHLTIDGHAAVITAVTSTHLFVMFGNGDEVAYRLRAAYRMLDEGRLVEGQGTLV